MQKTPLTALVTAEIVSILGSRMTYLALPWFVLATTGSDGFAFAPRFRSGSATANDAFTSLSATRS